MNRRVKALLKPLINCERKKIPILVVLMIGSALIELLSIGAVIPVISMLVDGRLTTLILGSWATKTEGLDTSTIPIIVVCLSILLFVGRFAGLAFIQWVQLNFVYTVAERVSLRMYASYLTKTYSFFLTAKTSQLIRNTTVEVLQYSNNCLTAALTVLSETFVLLAIVFLLACYDLKSTFFVVVWFGLMGVVFHAIVRQKLAALGRMRQENEAMRLKALQHGFSCPKDILLHDVKDRLVADYKIPNAKVAASFRDNMFLKQMPRNWIEFVGGVGLALLMLTYFSQGIEGSEIMKRLGLFGIAAFRVMPSISRISASLQALNYGNASLKLLVEESKSTDRFEAQIGSECKPLRFSEEIRVENIEFSYPGTSSRPLKNVSLRVNKGEFIGIVGGSGAGKSTLINVIVGLLAPNSGSVLVDGVNVQRNLRAWWRLIGYVPQEVYLFDDSLRNNISFGPSDPNAYQMAISNAQLEDLIESLPEGDESVVGERGASISGGQKQRVGIARALCREPQFLVFDEATSALDPNTEENVLTAIRENKPDLTIVAIGHRESALKHCDRVVRLNNGVLQ